MSQITRVLINAIPPLAGGIWLLFFGARYSRYGTLGDYHYRLFQLDLIHGSLLVGGWVLLGAAMGCTVAGITRKFYLGEFQSVPDEGTRFIWENHLLVTVLSVTGLIFLASGTIIFGSP